MSSTVSNPAPLRDHEADPSRATSHAIGFWQGVALIFGTNIGAGILSLPYAARNGGFLALVVALAIAGTLTTISMLYVAEVSLRTTEPLQLSGLAEKYMGQTGRFLVFAAIMVNSIGALIAYASGSGQLVHNIFGLPPLAGTLIFYALGAYIMWKGLQATGLAEGLITTGMAVIIFTLIIWTIAGPGIELTNLWVLKPYFIIPIMNLAVFTILIVLLLILGTMVALVVFAARGQGRIAHWQIPKELKSVAALPQLGPGKVDRAAVKELFD